MRNGIGQPLFELALQAAEERVFIRPAGHIRQLLLARILVALEMQRADLQALQIAQQLLVLVQIHAQLPGHLRLGRRVSQPRRENANRLLDGAALAAQLARAPVQGSETVQNRAPDTELGVAAELHLLGRIELGKGVHQTHHAGRNQVFDVHVLGKPLVNAAGQKTHDRQMLEQDPLLLAGQHLGGRDRGRIAVAWRPPRGPLLPRCGCRFNAHLNPPFLPNFFSAPSRPDATGSREESPRPRPRPNGVTPLRANA